LLQGAERCSRARVTRNDQHVETDRWRNQASPTVSFLELNSF